MGFWHSVLTLFGFGGLIFLHELGHYWMARRCKMRVEEFSIGLGWSLFSWRVGDVPWHVRCLPFGGFVRIAGMDAEEGRSSDPSTYYGSRIIDRVRVILAGPIANILTAFVLFCTIFALGGRYKSLGEVNSIIGWVDPKSELHRRGIRPGDRISAYDAAPFANGNDHLTAATFGGRSLLVEGERIDYANGTSSPFSEQISCATASPESNGIRNSGVLGGASALIFAQYMTAYSPLTKLDLHKGDRLLWANGERLFSSLQLRALLDDRFAFLTVERDGRRISQRIAKVDFRQLINADSASYKFEGWRAWKFDAGFGASQKFYCIPYELSSKGAIVEELIDVQPPREAKDFDWAALPKGDAAQLRIGDRILAVDGCPVGDSLTVARLLQTKHLALIVQRASSEPSEKSAQFSELSDAVHALTGPLSTPELGDLSEQVGSGHQVQLGAYCLLPPVEIPPLRAQLSEAQQLEVQAQKRTNAAAWDAQMNARMLGGTFRDFRVRVNINPLSALAQATLDPLRMLWGLVTGKLGLRVMSGPLGIMRVIYRSWSESFTEALFWLANISANLALFNLLPIPVLDGGHLVFALFEKVRGRPISAQLSKQLIYLFAVLLGALSLYILFVDLTRMFFAR